MIYKIQDEVLSQYLKHTDEDIKDIAKNTENSFTEYISIVMEFQSKSTNFKNTLNTKDFQTAFSELDQIRTTKHNLCLHNINIMNRLATIDNLTFCELPTGKTALDVNRTDLGQSIMKWYYDRGNELTDDMLFDIGIKKTNNSKTSDQSISNNNIKSNKSSRTIQKISSQTARLGDIVYARCRETEFLDEKYDIVNSDQDYGYANSKMRPMVILGTNNKNIVLAQIRHFNDTKEWGSTPNNMYPLDPTKLNSTDFDPTDQLVIGATGLRQIPISEFHYDQKLGRISSDDLKHFTHTFMEYKQETLQNPKKEHPILDSDAPIGSQWLKSMRIQDSVSSIPTTECNRIHPKDLIKCYRENNLKYLKDRNHLNKITKDLSDIQINTEVTKLIKLQQIISNTQLTITNTLGINNIDHTHHLAARKSDYFNKFADFRQEQLESNINLQSSDRPINHKILSIKSTSSKSDIDEKVTYGF